MYNFVRRGAYMLLIAGLTMGLPVVVTMILIMTM
jgi:hypothetical protein